MSINFCQINKLFGKREDTIHVHKTLGFLCVIHYSYRFYEWYSLKSMRFTNDYLTFSLICMHCFLSISSLIFHIPAVRNPISPMIYPEFRAHSIIFAMRSLLIMFIHWYFLYSEIKGRIYRSIICIGTIIAADYATKVYKPQGSTMRSMPFPKWIPEYIKRYWNFFYSVCQVFATLECLMRYNMSHAFMVLFPIQIAAFLMTCVRKGIITSMGWHIYYTLALISTMSYSLTCINSLSDNDLYLYRFFSIIFIFLRFKCNISKYILWISILVIYN